MNNCKVNQPNTKLILVFSTDNDDWLVRLLIIDSEIKIDEGHVLLLKRNWLKTS